MGEVIYLRGRIGTVEYVGGRTAHERCTDCGCELSKESVDVGRDTCFACYCEGQASDQRIDCTTWNRTGSRWLLSDLRSPPALSR
jgi:hypothetical protein